MDRQTDIVFYVKGQSSLLTFLQLLNASNVIAYQM